MIRLVCILCLVSIVCATRYTVDVSAPCNTNIRPTGVTSMPLDGHIQGPLGQELEAHLAEHNPNHEFLIKSKFTDCNTCDEYGCTQTGCAFTWKTTLYVRGSGSIVCPPFVRPWTPKEMRERWRRSLGVGNVRHDNWPFEQPVLEGDVPDVVE